jgi:hypothetical protein
MKSLLLAGAVLLAPLNQNNPEWYDKPTQVNCIDGYVRTVKGRVLWQENRIISAHATEQSVVYTPDGIGFTMNGDFHLFSNGRFRKGYSVNEQNFFTPDGIGVMVKGYVELNANSRIVMCELARETSLFIPDGTSRKFIGYVKFENNGRVTSGRVSQECSFFNSEGISITVPANHIAYLDTNGKLKYTRDSWSAEYRFEINNE